MENLVVTCSKIEDAGVERPNVFHGIGVGRWPLIVIELELEDLTVEKTAYQDAFVDEDVYIFQKEKRAYVGVLILDDVFDDVAHCSDLVVFQSAVDCRSVEKLFIVVRFLNFVFVKNRILSLEELLMFFTKKLFHGPTIER